MAAAHEQTDRAIAIADGELTEVKLGVRKPRVRVRVGWRTDQIGLERPDEPNVEGGLGGFARRFEGSREMRHRCRFVAAFANCAGAAYFRADTPRTAAAIMRLRAAIESPPSSVEGIVAKPMAEAFG